MNPVRRPAAAQGFAKRAGHVEVVVGFLRPVTGKISIIY